MDRNFDDYPGFQLIFTLGKHFAPECTYLVRSFGKYRYDREFRVLALTGRGNNLSNSRGMNLLRFGFIRQQFHDFFSKSNRYIRRKYVLIRKGCENLTENCSGSTSFLKKCQQILSDCQRFDPKSSENALGRVQRVHEPADIWDITFFTHCF